MDTNLWALEWSKKQCAFHIQPLGSAVRANQLAFVNGALVNDYIIVCVGSRAEVEAAAEAGRPTLRRRQDQQLRETAA